MLSRPEEVRQTFSTVDTDWISGVKLISLLGSEESLHLTAAFEEVLSLLSSLRSCLCSVA